MEVGEHVTKKHFCTIDTISERDERVTVFDRTDTNNILLNIAHDTVFPILHV